MRPAQKAPENKFPHSRPAQSDSCFNEAGAKSAGKRKPAITFLEGPISFNEAGAKSAGKHSGGGRDAVEDDASMRPAQKAPENPLRSPGSGRPGNASMRPAQKAPENMPLASASTETTPGLQ